MKSLSSCAALLLLLSSPGVARGPDAEAGAVAGVTVRHPEDGHAGLQEAVDAAGCGGTVVLAPGTYGGRVLAGCSVRILGSGVGETVIDATGLFDPMGTPAVVFGGHPFAEFDFTGPYELAHLTVRAGPAASIRGVGSAWAHDVRLHDLRIEGFQLGVDAHLTNGLVVDGVEVSGLGAPGTRWGIRTGEIDLFRDRLPGGHMTGVVVRDCSVEDTEFGISLENVVEAAILGNRIRDTSILGLQLLGAADCVVAGNDVARAGWLAGLNFQNCHGANAHHNRFCDNPVAIRYEPSFLPGYAGFGPSSGNLVHHNAFASNGTDLFEEDPDATGNRAHRNVEDPAACSDTN